jgi:hypothetical protein
MVRRCVSSGADHSDPITSEKTGFPEGEPRIHLQRHLSPSCVFLSSSTLGGNLGKLSVCGFSICSTPAPRDGRGLAAARVPLKGNKATNEAIGDWHYWAAQGGGLLVLSRHPLEPWFTRARRNLTCSVETRSWPGLRKVPPRQQSPLPERRERRARFLIVFQ